MTLTDEEARKVLAIIRSHGRCWACAGAGTIIPWASLTRMGDPVNCLYCDGKGNRHKDIITLLESRIGT